MRTIEVNNWSEIPNAYTGKVSIYGRGRVEGFDTLRKPIYSKRTLESEHWRKDGMLHREDGPAIIAAPSDVAGYVAPGQES